MKSPGITLVHVVDHSGHCVPGLARGWHQNGTIDFTVFTVPGAVTAMRGVKYQIQKEGEPRVEHTWHFECKNETFPPDTARS